MPLCIVIDIINITPNTPNIPLPRQKHPLSIPLRQQQREWKLKAKQCPTHAWMTRQIDTPHRPHRPHRSDKPLPRAGVFEAPPAYLPVATCPEQEALSVALTWCDASTLSMYLCTCSMATWQNTSTSTVIVGIYLIYHAHWCVLTVLCASRVLCGSCPDPENYTISSWLKLPLGYSRLQTLILLQYSSTPVLQFSRLQTPDSNDSSSPVLQFSAFRTAALLTNKRFPTRRRTRSDDLNWASNAGVLAWQFRERHFSVWKGSLVPMRTSHCTPDHMLFRAYILHVRSAPFLFPDAIDDAWRAKTCTTPISGTTWNRILHKVFRRVTTEWLRDSPALNKILSRKRSSWLSNLNLKQHL